MVSNAPKKTSLEEMLRAAFARWHVEMWFERAKQETGLGAFEVRTYQSLIRHWLCSRMAMYFLADQTERLRGEKSADHPGAGSRGGQRLGVENLEPVLALVCGVDRTLRVLPMAERGVLRQPPTKGRKAEKRRSAVVLNGGGRLRERRRRGYEQHDLSNDKFEPHGFTLHGPSESWRSPQSQPAAQGGRCALRYRCSPATGSVPAPCRRHCELR